jgi:hypothetical protein
MCFSRSEFLSHFERMHLAFKGTGYLAFATGYNTRKYEAKTIYAYCMGNTYRHPIKQRLASPFTVLGTLLKRSGTSLE